MGDSYRDLGNQSKAKDYYLAALNILEPRKNEHPEILIDTFTIKGNISHLSDDLQKAEIFYKNALLELSKLTDASNQQEKARVLRKLGDVYRSSGNYNEAEKQYLDDLAISTEELETASTLRKLGNIYQATNELIKAKQFYEKALAIKRKYSADNKMTLVNILNCLGNLYCYLNEPDRAIAVLEEARSIITDKAHLADTDNRYLTYTLKWLARAEILNGNFVEAKNLLSELQTYEDMLYSGKENIERGWTLYHLALYYKMMNNFVKAEKTYSKH